MAKGVIIAGLLILVSAVTLASPSVSAAVGEARDSAGDAGTAERWRQHRANVRIIRDDWGIAHIYGKTDADTVFGAIYSQAEDDFNRVELNYLSNLGRLAEAEGESAIYHDLRARLFVDPADLKRHYQQSPTWLKALMIAWADGLNFYLSTHKNVTPKVIRKFEPWMALSFTEGSIGGDIEEVDLQALEAFYGKPVSLPPSKPVEKLPGGSNGFAIAPEKSATGHALLLINPHTTHYFRSELQMVSDQGLHAYGAVTWGQFFIYQGFNKRNGWMHTSDGGDAIDEFAETIIETKSGLATKYGNGIKPVIKRDIAIAYRDQGRLSYRSFTVYRSHHGPIIRADGDKWIAFKILQSPVKALEQSFLRTKTENYAGFYRTQDMRTDTSNNTVYADADGTIAYFHGNFVPKRNANFDFTGIVDGANPATDWLGVHDVADTIHFKNPSTGWIQNTNNWPFSSSGAASPRQKDYARYMWTEGENARGLHAVELLDVAKNVTLDSLIALAYDSKLTGFDTLLPGLFKAFDGLAASDPRRDSYADAIQALRNWDHRSGLDSIATTLAHFWGHDLLAMKEAAAKAAHQPVIDVAVAQATDAERLDAFGRAIAILTRDFGTWKTPWGAVNRFQRVSDDIRQTFDDAADSTPVPFASAKWGSLAAAEPAPWSKTRRLYTVRGNSFVAAIEFGPVVKAKAIMAGGQSGDPSSPHFKDQIDRFAKGQLRDVYFYQADVLAHQSRDYRPGD